MLKCKEEKKKTKYWHVVSQWLDTFGYSLKSFNHMFIKSNTPVYCSLCHPAISVSSERCSSLAFRFISDPSFCSFCTSCCTWSRVACTSPTCVSNFCQIKNSILIDTKKKQFMHTQGIKKQTLETNVHQYFKLRYGVHGHGRCTSSTRHSQ